MTTIRNFALIIDRRARNMEKVVKSRFYIVPVLLHALDILEFVSRSHVPLRMDEIASETGVSRTTTYRILQTLVDRGYVFHDLNGKYSLANLPEMRSAFRKDGSATETEVSAVRTRSC
jgi:biotin operon repressor